MEAMGKIVDVSRDLKTNKVRITFVIDTLPSDLDELSGCDALDITAERHRDHRSHDANALLWECIGRISAALKADKWNIYLLMLKRYGIYTYLCVKPNAVEMMKKMWRACEEVGEIDINGQKAVQLLCYYGSSTYNTKQFSDLLDGVISEMKEIGVEPPMPRRVQAALEDLEKTKGEK